MNVKQLKEILENYNDTDKIVIFDIKYEDAFNIVGHELYENNCILKIDSEYKLKEKY